MGKVQKPFLKLNLIHHRRNPTEPNKKIFTVAVFNFVTVHFYLTY
jgi:hypothetical protein